MNNKAKNSQRWYFAWENLRGGFCCIFILLLMFFISFLIFIFLSFVDFLHSHFAFRHHPSPFRRLSPGFLHPFYTFSQAHRRLIRDTFIFNYSVIFLPRALRFWVDVFYPQAFFYLTLLHRYFWLNLHLSRSPRSRQFFLEVCRASYWSSKHRPDPSVCSILSNLQKIYIGRFYLSFRAARIPEESAPRVELFSRYADRVESILFCPFGHKAWYLVMN